MDCPTVVGSTAAMRDGGRPRWPHRTATAVTHAAGTKIDETIFF